MPFRVGEAALCGVWVLYCADIASLFSPLVTAGTVCLQWGKLWGSEPPTGRLKMMGRSVA